MSTREIIRDPATGEVILEVCVRSPFTDEERATMTEFALWARDHLPELTPEQIEQQEASRQRIRERTERLRGLRGDSSEQAMSFICEPCKQGEHDRCRGGTWCDCGHR